MIEAFREVFAMKTPYKERSVTFARKIGSMESAVDTMTDYVFLNLNIHQCTRIIDIITGRLNFSLSFGLE